MKKRTLIIVLLFAALTARISAQEMKCHTGIVQGLKDTVLHKAVCIIYPTQGNAVTGVITFTDLAEGGVKIVADLQNISTGLHGIHVHQCGDCSAADASSAGGHFNPGHVNHGAPVDTVRHAGDMGNIEADANQKAHMEYIDYAISLSGEHSIIGRSVIIHKDPDDLKSQPTGNAGARIACGTIGIIK